MPVATNHWPNIPNVRAARILSLLQYLDYSQWLPLSQIRAHQLNQIHALLTYTKEYTPFYRDNNRYTVSKNNGAQYLLDQWLELPILTRNCVQKNFTNLCSTDLPSEHGQPQSVSSSGSTGKPITVLTDAVTQLFWNTLTLRHYNWHKTKYQYSLATIRDIDAPFPGVRAEKWCSSTNGVLKTGPAFLLGLCEPELQLKWLHRVNPHYLMCYPSILRELLLLNPGKLSHLRHISTFAELVDPSLYQMVRDALNVPLHDTYSSTEVGYIALQCPEYGKYHIQEENLFVEVLDDNNQPCKPGEIGRVVITPLHNLASPLIRYEIGDYAEQGEPCLCGRGLGVLNQILGRQRNMITLPTGQKRWPSFTGDRDVNLITLLNGSQFQVIQKTLYDIEIKVVHPKGALPEHTMIPIIQSLLGYPFTIRFIYVDTIPRGARGKYEDFKSEL